MKDATTIDEYSRNGKAVVDQSPKKKPSRYENLKRMVPYIKPQRKTIVLAVICLILAAALDLLFLTLFNKVLSAVLNVSPTQNIGEDLGRLVRNNSTDAQIAARVRSYFAHGAVNFQHLNFFIGIVLLVGLGQALADYGQTYLTQSVGQRVLTQLRADMFARFQSFSISFFERRRTGELMSRMTNDMTALQNLMSTAVTTSVKTPLATVGTIVIMLYLNWKLSLFVVLILPPMAFLINRAGHRIRSATKQMQHQIGEMTNYLQEKISAMRLIQTFGTQQYEIESFGKVNEDSYRRAMKPVRIRATLAPSIDFIGLVGLLIMLWVGVRSGMKLNDLLTFLLAMHRTAMNLKALANLNNMFSSADAAAERMFEVLDTPSDINDKPNAIDLRERGVQGHLVFDAVRFSYTPDKEVLHGISFEVKPGEVVALAGLSGSGKTTISNLVPRLYDPTGGRVLVDGLDLRDVQVQTLRAHIGAVPQETTLFHGSIADNIAYGKPEATLEEITEAAKKANAHDFIMAQPDGYHTQIGERGGKLSGGQRQRLAIARALLRDPRILILDEATSSLDAESEAQVQDALMTLMKGRTTLIIAHRFSTIRHAHKIIVLEHGNIAEVGSHEELLAQGGIYSRLYEMQTFKAQVGDEEVEDDIVDETDADASTKEFDDLDLSSTKSTF